MDCSTPHFYKSSYIDTLMSNIYNNSYIKTEIDTLCSNIDVSNYSTKTEIDDLDR